MKNRRKTWIGVGLFALAGTSLSTAPVLPALAGAADQTSSRLAKWPSVDRPILLAQAGGEGGEGGGEGGGSAPETYSLLSTDPNAFNYEAGDEIAAYATGAHANYAASHAAAVTMKVAIDAFLADPSDAKLAAARKAWVAARPAYLVTEAYRFYDGPIEEIEGEINAWPLNEAFIDYVVGKPGAGIINDASEISIASLLVRNAASDEADVTLGWHAIEFLLWGQDLSATGPGNRPASDYIAGNDHNDRRREYLAIVTDRLVDDLDRLEQAWKPGVADNYAATFQTLPQREALGRIMNGMAVLVGSELMSERLAVGLDSGDQEDEHSCFSDTTHQDFVYDLQGVENIWTGTYPGATVPGLGSLVARVDPARAEEVAALLADAKSRIAALGDPWDQVLASPPGSPGREAGEAAVTALQKLGDGLKRAGASLGVLVQIPSG